MIWIRSVEFGLLLLLLWVHSFLMESFVGPAVYCCCIWNGKKKVHSHNYGDSELEKLVDICLEHTPPFHLWHFRTVKGRTYGFLMDEGITYFAIADSKISNPSILLFLQHIRDGYKKSSRNNFQEELVAIVQQLIASLESLPRQSAIDEITEAPSTSEGTTSTKMPLLGRSVSKQDRRKMDDDESHSKSGINLDGFPEVVGRFSLQNSTSSNHTRNQLIGRRLWLRQVKIVVAIDVVVCMVLFGIWLAICNRFSCVD